MKYKNIDHVVITTQNLDACLHFYVDILGMELDKSNGRYAVRFGSQKFNIHTRPAEFLPAAEHPTYGSLDLCLIIDGSIEEAKREIDGKGYPVELGPVVRHGALGEMQSIYLRDPDGNLVELAEYQKNECVRCAMKLKVIDTAFSVCKVGDYSKANLDAPFCFIGKTDEENSLVCRTEDVPDNATERDDGWRAFRIEGILDFSLIGILSKISGLLAENEIGIFAVSTFNTDYVLTKEGNFEKALGVLNAAGYEIQR